MGAALARAFADGGCDVAVDDVFESDAFERYWRHRLDGLAWKLVVILPSLDEALAQSAQRGKRVKEEQHADATGEVPSGDEDVHIDTSGLDLDESLAAVLGRLGAS